MPEQKISKREAVRQAIDAGKDKPTEGVKWIREKFGLEVDRHAFSLNKVAIRKQKASRAEPDEKPSALHAPGGDDAADLARGVKELVARFGAAAVRRMLEVFEG